MIARGLGKLHQEVEPVRYVLHFEQFGQMEVV